MTILARFNWNFLNDSRKTRINGLRSFIYKLRFSFFGLSIYVEANEVLCKRNFWCVKIISKIELKHQNVAISGNKTWSASSWLGEKYTGIWISCKSSATVPKIICDRLNLTKCNVFNGICTLKNEFVRLNLSWMFQTRELVLPSPYLFPVYRKHLNKYYLNRSANKLSICKFKW